MYVSESDDEDERGGHEIFVLITTKTFQDLSSILLTVTSSSELKSVYKFQLSVHVDEKRLTLIYD